MTFILSEIVESYYHLDMLNNIVIHGEAGVGKTAYSLKVLNEIYRDWDKAFDYFFISLLDFYYFVKDYVEREECIKVVVLDDITQDELNMYQWNQKKAKSFAKFLIGARNVVKNIIYTDPKSFINVAVRRMENIKIDVIPIDDTISEARIYKSHSSSFSDYYYKVGRDIFSRYLPNDVYKRYMRLRWNKSKKVLYDAISEYEEALKEEKSKKKRRKKNQRK